MPSQQHPNHESMSQHSRDYDHHDDNGERRQHRYDNDDYHNNPEQDHRPRRNGMKKSPSVKSKQSTPSYNTDSTSPETDYHEEEESSTNNSANFPSNEPTPFDDRGRCIKHPHIRLRRKKMLGGWKIMMTNCPDCCIEQMLAMRDEQQRSKRGKKGSGERRRSNSRDSNGNGSQGGASSRSQRKQIKGSNRSGAVKRSDSVDSSSKNMPPISQLTIRTNDGGGDNASDCGSMGSSASEITYGTNGGRSSNAGSGSGSNEYPHHVTRMPFTDAYGDKGWYTGEVASVSGLPHGKGTMHYCDGRVRDALWSNGMAGGTQQQQKRASSHGAPPPPVKLGSNGSSVESPPQQQQLQQRERRRPMTDMPWTDLIGESGLYSGQIDENGEPHGMGMMKYDDGSFLEGEWYHGELERRRESGGGNGGNQGRSRGPPVSTRL